MKGVVLAGGLGTRLAPMTRVVNKHLLDVYDEPMLFFPLKSLIAAGITDITIVTGAEIEQFRTLLGTGDSLGARFTYAQQQGETGIADALRSARETVNGQSVAVILGDNIYQDDLSPYVEAFERQGGGARVLLKRLGKDDVRRFGVAEVKEDRIERIVEKPADPTSDLVVTGFYIYDANVFDIIDTLEPSARGEYEISDVNNTYIERGTMHFDVLSGWWTDAGTPASKLKAAILVALNKGVTFHA